MREETLPLYNTNPSSQPLWILALLNKCGEKPMTPSRNSNHTSAIAVIPENYLRNTNGELRSAAVPSPFRQVFPVPWPPLCIKCRVHVLSYAYFYLIGVRMGRSEITEMKGKILYCTTQMLRAFCCCQRRFDHLPA